MTQYFETLFSGANPVFLFGIMVWVLFWKGVALWHAAQKQHTVWFIALLFLNTLGILEVIYLFFIRKMSIKDILIKESK
jgi:methionyl-tRNA synthetase